MAIHIGDKVKFINGKNVIYFEAEGNYSKLFLENGEIHQMAKPLSDIEESLASDKKFFRISRSVIVNLDQVSHYTKGNTCVLTLSNNVSFEVSRRRKVEINNILK